MTPCYKVVERYTNKGKGAMPAPRSAYKCMFRCALVYTNTSVHEEGQMTWGVEGWDGEERLRGRLREGSSKFPRRLLEGEGARRLARLA